MTSFLVGLQLQDMFVLCRVFKKNGIGPRSSEDHGPQTYVKDDLGIPLDMEVVKKVLELGSALALVIEAPLVSTPPPANIVPTV